MCDSKDFCTDLPSGFNETINKIKSNTIIYNSMSDPSNIDFPSFSFNAAHAAATASSNQNMPSDASIFSYFTPAHAISEVKTELPEMLLVFITSAGISYYMGDEIVTACERGGILAFGQYWGGYLGDAMANSKWNMTQFSGMTTKFVVVTSIFVAGNRYLLESQQPLTNLVGESFVASLVAHFGANAVTPFTNPITSALPSY